MTARFDPIPRELWPRDLTPIAYVRIDGLAICRFVRRQWQITLYHESHHKLWVENDEIGEITLDTTAEEFRIYSSGDSPYDQYPDGYYRDDSDFERLKSVNSPYDFRWVLDIASGRDLPPGKVRLRQPANYSTTTVTIQNALMYTGSLTEQSLYRVPINVDANGNQGAMVEIGKVNDTIIAAVFGDDSRLRMETIRSNGGSELRRLSASTEPHKIDLMNMRPHVHASEAKRESARRERWAEGDFKLFYQAVLADQQWSLWGEPLQRSDRIDCDSITLSNES